MIKEARAQGLQDMMGCMNDCSIGSAAIAHYLSQLDFVDMDGPLLLSEDLEKGLQINSGVIEKPRQSGLGIELNNKAVFHTS